MRPTSTVTARSTVSAPTRRTMSETDQLPAAPPPELRFRRGFAFKSALTKLWSARHVVWNLGMRELRVRYNQAVLGFGWAIIGPVVLMVIISTLLKQASGVKINTHGWPYPIFLYTGLLAWTFFSNAVSSAGNILVSNPLLNKIYAPREVFVLGTIGTSIVDGLAATLVLGVLFAIYQRSPAATVVWVPVALVVLLAYALGVGLIFAAATVYMRDLRQVLPLLLQFGLFATPVIWPLSKLAPRTREIYVALNPVGAVIDTLRRTMLYGQAPDPAILGIGAASSALVLIFGYALFKRLETGFADVS